MLPCQAKVVKQRDNEKYYPLVQRWPKIRLHSPNPKRNNI